MDPALVDCLGDDLAEAAYRPSNVTALLGEAADAARRRGVFAPARRVLSEREPSPLRTLVSLLLLDGKPSDDECEDAFPHLGVAGTLALGLLVRNEQGSLTPALSLNPEAVDDTCSAEPFEWWILSDLDDQLRRGPARPEHVMGVGGATRSLIALAPSDSVEMALDLGTGCGIVALHLAQRGPVIATDISDRALMLAAANARLNRVTGIEFRRGDLFTPVENERFDLILSNPPFVITPRSDGPRYEYRDGGLVGDTLAERVVTGAVPQLRAGGTLLCLANWESPWGSDGLERVRGWITDGAQALGADSAIVAWVIERDRVLPSQYAETWARDGGARPGEAEFEELMHSWLNDFAERRIASIGLGSVRVRRLPQSTPSSALPTEVIHTERATGALSAQPAGDVLRHTFDAAVATEQMSDETMLDTHFLAVGAVQELRLHDPGQEAPSAISLSSEESIARRVTADPLLAATVGACDGELSLGQIADALATLLEVEEAATREAVVTGVRELVWLGMLAPASS